MPLTTDLSTVTDSTFSISGRANIVFNNKDSNIDLKPLAPVFLLIAFLDISIKAMVKANYNYKLLIKFHPTMPFEKFKIDSNYNYSDKFSAFLSFVS